MLEVEHLVHAGVDAVFSFGRVAVEREAGLLDLRREAVGWGWSARDRDAVLRGFCYAGGGRGGGFADFAAGGLGGCFWCWGIDWFAHALGGSVFRLAYSVGGMVLQAP